MRLLFVHSRLGLSGGAEANIIQTAAALRGRGHQVGLLHGAPTGTGEELWRRTFSPLFALPAAHSAGPAEEAFRVFGPDLVYVHKTSDLELLEAILDRTVPAVRMVHDHDLYCMRSYKYHFLTRTICRRPASRYCLFPCAAFLGRNPIRGFPVKWVSYSAKKKEIQLNQRFHRLLVATGYMQAELRRNGFAPEQIEIHPPVPPRTRAAEPSSFGERNRIVFAGQIIRGKGVDILLEALARVGIPFECVIAGEGNHRPYCEQLSRRLGLGARVQFTGFIPPDRLPDYYREASLAVVSSVWPEPFGAVGLEAMHHGLPVVAFDAGGIPEWLRDGENGFLVPWMDRELFAAQIERLLRDKDLARRMGERGRRLVIERYNFSDYVSGLENLFRRMVSESRPVLAA